MNRFASSFPGLGWTVTLLPLCGLCFYAPLAFGGTTPATVVVIDTFLLASFILWLGQLIINRRVPKFPVICLIALGFLTCFGLIHLLNPKAMLQRDLWRFFPLPEPLSWLPGTLDVETSTPIIRHFGAMLLAFLVLLDACRFPRPRWFLLRVISISGLMIAVIGVLQKASAAEAMLWVSPDRSGSLFFGAFRYNANAAAFLNLSWPAALAIWLKGRVIEPGSAKNSIDFCSFFFLVIAVFVNSSKAGHILVILGLALSLWWFRKLLRPKNVSKRVMVISGMLFLVLSIAAILPAFVTVFSRWEDFSESPDSFHGRLLLYEASSQILPTSGWFGTGPGTFQIVFPFYTGYLGDQLSGIYTHTHQDYLQTMIEWGFLGFFGWAVLVGGGLLFAIRFILQMKKSGKTDLSAKSAMLALLIVLLHAMADFPLQIPSIQWLIAIYLAICWSTVCREEVKTAKAAAPLPRIPTTTSRLSGSSSRDFFEKRSEVKNRYKGQRK